MTDAEIAMHEAMKQNHERTTATIVALIGALGEANLANPDELSAAVVRIHPAAVAWLDQYRAEERDRKEKEDGGE